MCFKYTCFVCFCLQVLNEKKLQEVDSLWKEFETPEKANKICEQQNVIVMSDLDSIISILQDKLNLSCIHSPMVTELMRGIRSQIEGLITGLPSREMAAMCLGLAHSLSRYKLKFSPDKVDTMIVQAICKYIFVSSVLQGLHFPTCLASVILGECLGPTEQGFLNLHFHGRSHIVQSGGALSLEPVLIHVTKLCLCQVIEISEYRTQLYDYLKNRMMAIAPNLTVMVGELVGARLIAHAGSLLNLAKHPASTVQILGAEKALFRALKTKRDTPKFGLIYHASLVGQTTAKNKGKISRMLAAKTALTIRYDALGEDTSAEMGAENRLKVETRLRHLEERGVILALLVQKKKKEESRKTCQFFFEYFTGHSTSHGNRRKELC
uniref:Nucleolar protein 58 n=1 Tax=Pavo cristatus TaxID=9049 RepID=A0A8C9EYP3_PAVCR